MHARRLGRSNLDVSPLGLGGWAIGGPTQYQGHHFGWGEIDEDEAIRAIHVALDAGITLFDTADIYGTGHSERILGRALAGRRDQVLIATKFGLTFEEYSGNMTCEDASPAYIQTACEASLRILLILSRHRACTGCVIGSGLHLRLNVAVAVIRIGYAAWCSARVRELGNGDGGRPRECVVGVRARLAAVNDLQNIAKGIVQIAGCGG